jgi:type II restriction enzyme
MNVTAADLASWINQLPKNRIYHYINPANKGQIEIVRVDVPEGPVIIKRYNPSDGETSKTAKEESISPQLLWRVANGIQDGVPLNIDRLLGASYNTRSVLESLLAHTPQFFTAYPGRIECVNSFSKIKKGHKHLLWLPNAPHKPGVVSEITTDKVISEIPSQQVIYEALVLPEMGRVAEMDIDMSRRHAQIQIALVLIGVQLGFRSWIAQNDKGITYNNTRLGEMNGVINSLNDEKMLSAYSDAIKAALLIDCIWFKNGKLMPAVMEVEHTTGITSGLTRMKNFQDNFPPFPTRYVVVAPDEDREKFVREAVKPQFRPLNARFFPFSAVEELYWLCQRRKITGVTEEFLDCYMEPITLSGN